MSVDTEPPHTLSRCLPLGIIADKVEQGFARTEIPLNRIADPPFPSTIRINCVVVFLWVAAVSK